MRASDDHDKHDKENVNFFLSETLLRCKKLLSAHLRQGGQYSDQCVH